MSRRTVYAQVAFLSPLAVYFDGDSTHAIRVQSVPSYTPTVGDRVQVQVRSPLPSLVLGRVQ